MPPIDPLLESASAPVFGCCYAQLIDTRPYPDASGRQIQLVCLDEDLRLIEAFTHKFYAHLLEPYLQELRAQPLDLDTNWPVVPLFQAYDGSWRFSWPTASREHPHLTHPEIPTEPFVLIPGDAP